MRKALTLLLAVLILAVTIACGAGTPAATSPTAAPAAAPAATPLAGQASAAPAAASTEAPAAAPEATAAPAANAMGKVGDRLEANGIALTISKAERNNQIGQFQKAQAGNTFVIADVLIENVSADKADYNFFYFKAKDADGFEYQPTINTDPQSLKSGNLAKGDKVRGSVAFEVKESAKGLVLEYKPISIVGDTAPIRVALE